MKNVQTYNLKPFISKSFAGKVFSVSISDLNQDIKTGMIDEKGMKDEKGLYFLEILFNKKHNGHSSSPEIERIYFTFDLFKVFFSTNGEKIHIFCTNLNGDIINMPNSMKDLIESKFGTKMSKALRELDFQKGIKDFFDK